MLVLTRKAEESILLGSEIRVTVLSVSGDKVRLGIDAPSTVKILRGETLAQSREENKISAASGVSLAALLKKAAEDVQRLQEQEKEQK